MSASENQSTEKLDKDFTRTWRYKIGLFMIIAGHLILLLGFVLPFLGVPAAFVGAAVMGGEGLSMASIIFLGKNGFKAIKSKIFGVVKAGYAASVGPVRHYIGIVLLLTNMLTTYTLMLYAWTAFDVTTPENPMPAIWGLDFAQQGSLVFWLFLIGECTFVIAIYVLGADWWGKFRRIFAWEPAES